MKLKMKSILLFVVINSERKEKKIYELISSKVKYFTNLQDKQQLFWVLNCEELDILNCLGRFLQISLH